MIDFIVILAIKQNKKKKSLNRNQTDNLLNHCSRTLTY